MKLRLELSYVGHRRCEIRDQKYCGTCTKNVRTFNNDVN